MSFDWLDYLKFAEHIHKEYNCEAAIRSGVSRSYYSIFSTAKLFCLSENLITTKESKSSKCHQTVIEVLKDHDELDFVKIGKKLETLRERRNDADYEKFSRGFDSRFLISTIELTKETFEIINSLKI